MADRSKDKADEGREAGQTPIPSAHIKEIAADLRAGKITAAQAVDRILDDTLGRRVPPGLTATAAHELENLLKDLVTNDPALKNKIERLSKLK